MNKEELKEEAISLRLSGLTYPEISSTLNGALSIDQCKRLLKGIKPLPMKNDIREAFSEEWYGREDSDTWPVWIDDIVTGVARLDWYGDKPNQIPLATTKIIKCYLWLDEFTVSGIAELLECSKRMAQHYLKACKLCLPFFKRSLDNPQILSMRYPRRSIVSEKQGYAEGYDRADKRYI